MKVSEAINQLETILEEEGDIEVFTDTDGDYGDPTSIVVEEEEGERFATLQAESIEIEEEVGE